MSKSSPRYAAGLCPFGLTLTAFVSSAKFGFSHYTLYNWNFYFYNWVTLAGIAQLVEHDLAKVGVEGPSPFSRSKTKKTPTRCLFSFYNTGGDPAPSKRVRPNSFLGKAREKNLELNANEVSVEPVGRQVSRAAETDAAAVPFPIRRIT